jgi:shikimate kinase
MAQPVRRIWLVGMMGSGKSTVGATLADRLGWVAVDTDAVVERRAGKRVATLWRDQGEAAFRALEVGAIAEASASPDPAVISVGGGAVLDPASRARMRGSGSVVWLRAEVSTLVARIGTGVSRPALGDDPLAAVAVVDAARRGHYEQLAQVVVDVDELTPSQVAEVIVGALDGPDALDRPDGGEREAESAAAGRSIHA